MELEKLAQTCSFGDYLDKALRNQFVFGLQNRAIQSRLLEIRDLTLAKAKDIAFGMEMSNRGTDDNAAGGCVAPSQRPTPVLYTESGIFFLCRPESASDY